MVEFQRGDGFVKKSQSTRRFLIDQGWSSMKEEWKNSDLEVSCLSSNALTISLSCLLFPAAAISLCWTSSLAHGPAEYPVYSSCLYYYTKGL